MMIWRIIGGAGIFVPKNVGIIKKEGDDISNKT
jgi:hypothetical protein